MWSLYRILKIATDIIPKLPEKDDSKLALVVKALGVWDSIEKYTSNSDSLKRFFRAQGKEVESRENRHFADLLFGTALLSEFEVSRIPLEQSVTVIWLRNASLGELFFVESYGMLQPEFWVAPNFDYSALVEHLWVVMDNRIHLAMVEKNYRIRTEVTAISPVQNEITGRSKEHLEAFAKRHRTFALLGFPRTYLLLGPQGTGKTTFGLRLGRMLDCRILRIDATSLTGVGAQDLEFILQILRPGITLVDDIEKAPDLMKSLPKLLTTLAELHSKYPELTVILTSNTTNGLDLSFLRPERVDEIIDFQLPNADERLEILRSFLDQYGFGDNKRERFNLKALIAQSEGLSAVYMGEIAKRMHVDTPDEVSAYIARMRQLVAEKKDEATETGKASPDMKPAR